MMIAVADTHAVVWYLANDSRLSANARKVFEDASLQGETVAVSAITLVEMVYLVERGRIPTEYLSRLLYELGSASSVLAEASLSVAIVQALSRIDAMQIPDMPDRIIAATALHLNLPLISRDHKIRASAISTIW